MKLQNVHANNWKVIILLFIAILFYKCNNQKVFENDSDSVMSLKVIQENQKQRLILKFYNPYSDSIGIYYGGQISFFEKGSFDHDLFVEIKQSGRLFCYKDAKKKQTILGAILPKLIKIASKEKVEIVTYYNQNIRENYGLSSEPFELRVKLLPMKEKTIFIDTSMKTSEFKNFRIIKDTLVTDFVLIK